MTDTAHNDMAVKVLHQLHGHLARMMGTLTVLSIRHSDENMEVLGQQFSQMSCMVSTYINPGAGPEIFECYKKPIECIPEPKTARIIREETGDPPTLRLVLGGLYEPPWAIWNPEMVPGPYRKAPMNG